MEATHTWLMIVKVVTGFAALFAIVLMTGRASIYQLTPFQLVFVLVLGDYLGNAAYENSVSLLQFLIAVGLWGLLMLLVEFITQRFKGARSLLVGNPAIIIRDGILDREQIRRNKLDLNQVTSLLRQENVFSVREVKFGILEANGQISILLKSGSQTAVRRDLKLPEEKVELPTALIMDGEVLWDNLRSLGFDGEWLKKELSARGHADPKTVFFADWRGTDGLHISPF